MSNTLMGSKTAGGAERKQRTEPLLHDDSTVLIIRELEGRIAAYPGDIQAHADLGGLYIRQGDKQRSASHFEKALRLQKIEALLGSARAYSVKGLSDKARDCCVRVLALEPKNSAAQEIYGTLMREGADTAATPGWLSAYPDRDGFYEISSERGFAHEESDYDQQHHIDAAELNVGLGLVNLLREKGAEFSGPALEIGCGTGLLSVGLVKHGSYPLILLTDPSFRFLQLTHRKLLQAGASLSSARFAVLKGEDLGRLPGNEFSLVILRSVLHHVPDVPTFIRAAAAALRPGGILTFQEPCMDGFVLLGAMAQFIPSILRDAGHPLDAAQLKQVDVLVRTMQFYARRDIDKTAAEDKHLFRVDEMMQTCSEAGLDMEFMPNMTFEHYSAPPQTRTQGWSFSAFFHDYLAYLMSFDPALMKLIDEHFRGYCDYLDVLTAKGNGPYVQGVFLCRKR